MLSENILKATYDVDTSYPSFQKEYLIISKTELKR